MPGKIGFEGLVGRNDFVIEPDGYQGLNWTRIGALGDHLMQQTTAPTSGYAAVIRQHTVGFAYGGEMGESNVDAGFSYDGTFTLKSGLFASAFNNDEEVTFTAYRDGVVVGTQTVFLSVDGGQVDFNHHFRHIDAVHISSEGGTDADPSDGDSGQQIALDNLKIIFDPAPAGPVAPAAAAHEHPSGYAHGVAHADWAFV